MKMSKEYQLSSFLLVAGEMIDGQGEDSYSYECTEKKGYVGVFDGCGGTGSKRYECFNSHTGAFLSSRIAAFTTQKWWNAASTQGLDVDTLHAYLHENLSIFKKAGEQNRGDVVLKGSLSQKTFPTTAVIITYDFSEKPLCKYVWAGDSRGYLLDRCGLCQVTEDDIDSAGDAYENIKGDARVNNVINADKEFYLRQKEIAVTEPCMVLAVTDGCFSYMDTPMEFEYLLLSSLNKSSSLYEWEKRIDHFLQDQAADDFTMAVLLFGFKRFQDIKTFYRKRLQILTRKYVNKLNIAKKTNDKTSIHLLWEQYKGLYYRYEQ